MPDANTRVAALLSGQIDWVEAPPPDTVPRLKQQGMQVVSNVYPHVWPYWLSYTADFPFRDIRVRKAANLAIDREGLCQFLGGLAKPARGQVDVSHPSFGKPTFEIKYDPAAAKKLMAEAGYGPANRCKSQVPHLASGIRADAAAADERVCAGEPEPGRFRGRDRGRRLGGLARTPARPCRRRGEQGRLRPQQQLVDHGSRPSDS